MIGLKENVIIGKLIPAGTGMKRYRNVRLNTEYTEDINDDLYSEAHSEDFETLTIPREMRRNGTRMMISIICTGMMRTMIMMMKVSKMSAVKIMMT